MNQILYQDFTKDKLIFSYPRRMKLLFIVSILIIIICIIVFVYLRYNSFKNQKIAENLKSKFEIQNLYTSKNSNYISQKLSSDTRNSYYFVIGLLKIEKINLTYPILSETSDDLLEIAPCRFYGPMPNEVGNLCIAGHNYANQTHFAKIHLLEVGDIIQIYDLSGNKINYQIYSKKEISSQDTSCLSQDTNSLREITLITCKAIKGNRIVIKAKENR